MTFLKGYCALFLFLVLLSSTDSCRLLKHDHDSGAISNYYLVQPYFRECNQEPIYKMLNKPFYIYKSSNNYWCDSYIPSNVVDCDAPCDEMRFLLTNKNSTTLEEFNSRFNMWLPKHTDSISCADQFNKNNELEATNSNATTSNGTTQVVLKKDKSKSSSEKRLGSVGASSKSQKQCPRIEFQLFDKNILKHRVQFTVVLGVHCKGHPVYKSKTDIYVYRNLFGHWCQDALDFFDVYETCNQACKQKTIQPSGISSPLESTSLEVLNGNTRATVTSRNYRYLCTSFVNCEKTPCFNNGTCVTSVSPLSGKTEYKCECAQSYGGILCDTIIDFCSLETSPCWNNGTCLSKSYEPLRCECPRGYRGNACETYDHCLIENRCLNGAQCISNGSNTTKCECGDNFEGETCELIRVRECLDQPEGTIFPNPNDETTFILCIHNGAHNIQKCPQGLVFNSHSKRCDYNNNKLDVNNPCEPNPCLHLGLCTLNSQNESQCMCANGYTGQKCEINIDDCSLHNLCGPTGQCVDLVSGHVCFCQDGTYGNDCLTNRVSIPCAQGFNMNVSYHTYAFDPQVMVICNENGRVLLNKCPQSLYWNPSSASCTYEPVDLDIQAPCSLFHCKNDGKCVLDRTNAPFCVCEKGFSGEHCEINIDDCDPNPCMNNGTCVDGVNSYYCVCENKYIDRDCCCIDANNTCASVVEDARKSQDGIARHPHPFTSEQYLVCNLEGYAQVLSCPNGLIWTQEYQTCVLKDTEMSHLFTYLCLTREPSRKFMYPHSKLKFIRCINDKEFLVETCPKVTPYFCEKTKDCVSKYDTIKCNA